MSHAAKQEFDQAIDYNVSAGRGWHDLDIDVQSRIAAIYTLTLPGTDRCEWMESLLLKDSDQICAYIKAGEFLKLGGLMAAQVLSYHQKEVEEIYFQAMIAQLQSCRGKLVDEIYRGDPDETKENLRLDTARRVRDMK